MVWVGSGGYNLWKKLPRSPKHYFFMLFSFVLNIMQHQAIFQTFVLQMFKSSWRRKQTIMIEPFYEFLEYLPSHLPNTNLLFVPKSSIPNLPSSAGSGCPVMVRLSSPHSFSARSGSSSSASSAAATPAKPDPEASPASKPISVAKSCLWENNENGVTKQKDGKNKRILDYGG